MKTEISILFVVLYFLITIGNIKTQVDPDLDTDQGGRLENRDFINAEQEQFIRLPQAVESNNVNNTNIFEWDIL